jgi:hypothetical protein
VKFNFKIFAAVISAVVVTATVIATVYIYKNIYDISLSAMETLLLHPLKALFDEYPIWEAIIEKY